MSHHHRPRVWPDTPDPLAAPVMDNHTHLPLRGEEIPRAQGVRLALTEQLARAAAVGVTRVVTSACAVPDLDPALQLARASLPPGPTRAMSTVDPGSHRARSTPVTAGTPSPLGEETPRPRVGVGIRVALAIHPNEAALHAGFTEASPDGLTPERAQHHRMPLVEALEEVARRLDDPAVVAVGETGLDYFRTAEPGREAQREALRAHVEMAQRHDLPVQIHDRDAHADCLAVLRDAAAPDQRIVFHCFSGDAAMARELAARGWCASFAGTLTYPGNERLRAAVCDLPRELVLVETDAPFLTPVPWRGSPNASYVMAHTVRAIAELWGVSEQQACRQLDDNETRIYGSW